MGERRLSRERRGSVLDLCGILRCKKRSPRKPIHNTRKPPSFAHRGERRSQALHPRGLRCGRSLPGRRTSLGGRAEALGALPDPRAPPPDLSKKDRKWPGLIKLWETARRLRHARREIASLSLATRRGGIPRARNPARYTVCRSGSQCAEHATARRRRPTTTQGLGAQQRRGSRAGCVERRACAPSTRQR